MPAHDRQQIDQPRSSRAQGLGHRRIAAAIRRLGELLQTALFEACVPSVKHITASHERSQRTRQAGPWIVGALGQPFVMRRGVALAAEMQRKLRRHGIEWRAAFPNRHRRPESFKIEITGRARKWRYRLSQPVRHDHLAGLAGFTLPRPDPVGSCLALRQVFDPRDAAREPGLGPFGTHAVEIEQMALR